MKLLYCYEGNHVFQDIVWGFVECGVEVIMHTEGNKRYSEGAELEREAAEIERMVKQNKCDGVLSWNYYVAVSVACERLGIPYISWIFDSPLVSIYTDTMLNSCNYFFVFDKMFCQDIKAKGCNSYYLPLAVNATRLGAMNITDEQISRFSEEVSFVGSLYTLNGYNTAKKCFSEEIIAKHEKIFSKQYGDWQNDYICTDVTDEDVASMEKYAPIGDAEAFPYMSKKDRYVGAMLYPKMAEYERFRILNELAKHCRVSFYNGYEDHSMLKNVICKPETNYELETPIVYFSSKINLNMTLRSIQTGLPLRVFDIMGVGGFLMSNYQQEFEELYTPDKDVVLYSSIDELIDKTKFYLTHERERLTIAMNGYKRTISEHTMKIRAVQMLNTVFGDKWRK